MALNFLVYLGIGDTEKPVARFRDCNVGVDVSDNEKGDVRKINGLNKFITVIMKRGIIESPKIYQWIEDIRNRSSNASRTVTIHIQCEDHSQIVQTWKLFGLTIIKHVSDPLNAEGRDVAIEELTLACERLEIE
jgi:phage tail-like protein